MISLTSNLTQAVEVKMINNEVLSGKMDMSGEAVPETFALLVGTRIYIIRMAATLWIRTVAA